MDRTWARAIAAIVLNCVALSVLTGFAFFGAVDLEATYFPLLVLVCSFVGFPLLRDTPRAFVGVQIATFVCFIFVAPLTAMFIGSSL